MSENINRKNFHFKQGKSFSGNEFADHDEEMSRQAKHSEFSKISKVAEVSPPVPHPDTTR